MTIVRRAVVVSSVIALSFTSLLGWAGQAGAVTAAPAKARSSAPNSCHNEGSSYWTTSAHGKKRMTHVDGWHIGPGLSTSRTKSVEKVLTLSASVKTTSGANAKITAGKVLGEIQARYDIELAASGSVSKRTSESVTWSVAAAKKDRYYALYSGHVQWTGSWVYHWCQYNYWHIKQGKWQSFDWTKIEGGALCTVGKTTRRSAYSKGSPPYLACQRTWWGS